MQIKINASTSYDGPTKSLPVNGKTPLVLDTILGKCEISVQIKGYELDGQPVDSEYFELPERKGQSFSIQFVLNFNQDVKGSDLLWGNDFDSPIRDLLPWGFSAAFATFKRLIDPSVDGDVYADKPYLYGPCLTSINYINKQPDDDFVVPVVESVGETPSARQRLYLDENKRTEFVFEKGATYAFDFCNPFFEFSKSIAIHLPGFTFDIGKYAGKTSLRYVLKNGDNLVFALTFSASDGATDKQFDEKDNSESNSTSAEKADDSSIDEPNNDHASSVGNSEAKNTHAGLDDLGVD